MISNSDKSQRTKMTGLILAGGLSRRMGNIDKSLAKLNGKPLIQYVVESLQDQVDDLYISANQNNAQQLAYLGHTVIIDEDTDKGPLGGIYTCMRHATTPYIICTSCDSPFIPSNLADTLLCHAVNNDLSLCYAQSKQEQAVGLQPALIDHYTHSLWAKSLLPLVEQQLKNKQLALRSMVERTSSSPVIFEQGQDTRLFYNINSPEDLTRMQRLS